jgi:hypothetical protein
LKSSFDRLFSLAAIADRIMGNLRAGGGKIGRRG